MPKTIRTFSIHMPQGDPRKKDVTLLFDRNVKVTNVVMNGTDKPRYIKGSDNTHPDDHHADGMYNKWEIGVFPNDIQGCNTIEITVETDTPCECSVEVDWTETKGSDYLPQNVDVPPGGLHGDDSIKLKC